MKRIKDNPLMSKKYSEGKTPFDGEVIPRSWEAWQVYFPFSKFKDKYPQKARYSHSSLEPIVEFTQSINWVYRWEVVLKWMSKWGKANDKLYCYDNITWADFSFDIESVNELLYAVSDGSSKIIKWDKDDELIIQWDFTMRGHFLMPYSQRYEDELLASVKKKEEDRKRKLKASEYVDWMYCVDKDWYEYQWFENPVTIYRKNIQKYQNWNNSKVETRHSYESWNCIGLSWLHAYTKWKSWAYWKIDKPKITLEELIKKENDKADKEIKKDSYTVTYYSLTKFN